MQFICQRLGIDIGGFHPMGLRYTFHWNHLFHKLLPLSCHRAWMSCFISYAAAERSHIGCEGPVHPRLQVNAV
jgi:hypothetical protein